MRNGFYYFGPFRMEPATRTLLRNGIILPLTEREFDVLLVLVRSAGAIISKKTLIDSVWGPDQILEDSNLGQHISALKKKLGEAPDGKPYIRNVARQGYYLAATVTDTPPEDRVSTAVAAELGSASPDAERDGAPEVQNSPSEGVAVPPNIEHRNLLSLRGVRLGVVAMLLPLLAFAVYWFSKPRPYPQPPRPARRSIAVLNFQNLTGSPETAWLATALPDMLRMELAASKGLRTASQEEVARVARELHLEDGKLRPEAVESIRKSLGVQLALTGSYVSFGEGSQRQLRIDLRVIDTATGETIAMGSRTALESGLLDLMSQLGALLRADLGQGELSAAELHFLKATRPGSYQSEQLYAEGLAKLRVLDAVTARPLLENAISIEPQFWAAHATLSEAWETLGYLRNARDEAKKALDLTKGLSQEQILPVEARYRRLDNDWGGAIEIYKSLWRVIPDNPDNGLSLAIAQTDAGKPKDALQTIGQLRRTRTPEGIDLRVDLAEAAALESLGDFKGELATAERSAQAAAQQGSRFLEANALLRACWALVNLGRRQEATDAATHAKNNFVVLGDRGGEARSLRSLGDVLDYQGQHREAKKDYETAAAIFGRIGYEGAVATTLTSLGYAVKDLGDLAGAGRLFEEALDVSRRIGDEGREAYALNGAAIVLWRQGDLVAATETYEKALTIHQRRQEKSRIAVILGNLAIVIQDQGRLVDAKQRFDEGLQAFREIGDQGGVARMLGSLGDVLLKLGEPVAAKNLYSQQFDLAQRMGDNKQQAYALHGLGEALAAAGELSNARSKFEGALALRVRLGERGLAAESRLALAEIALDEKDFSRAAAEAGRAAAELRKEEEPDETLQAESVWAVSLGAQGLISEALARVNRLKRKLGAIQDIDLRLASAIYLARVEAGAGHIDVARTEFNQALREAGKFGYLQHELNARLNLALLERNAETRKRDLGSVEQRARSKGLMLLARLASS